MLIIIYTSAYQKSICTGFDRFEIELANTHGLGFIIISISAINKQAFEVYFDGPDGFIGNLFTGDNHFKGKKMPLHNSV